MSEEKVAKIYKITNTANGWVYIGSTLADKIETRLKGHFKSARLGVKSNLMYMDMRKQKNEDFIIELLDTCEPRHRFMIEEWYTRDAFKKYDKVYNKKSGNAIDENTAQRISESHKKYVVEHPEAFDEEFRESCARPGEKNGMWGKSGENAINGRSVYMLDDNKNVIKIFPSVQEAKKFLHTKAHSALCKACRNGTKYKGYYWAKEWVKTFEEEKND